MEAFRSLPLSSVATHIGVGVAAASYWRGLWYILDDHLFPNDAFRSACASLGLGATGMALSQGLVEKAPAFAYRMGALYTLSSSVVLVWRGTWMMWDIAYEGFHNQPATDPGHATRSGLISHGLAITALLGCGLFASVLAPPAAASVIKDLAVKAPKRHRPPPSRHLSGFNNPESFFARRRRTTTTTTGSARW